MSDNPLARSQEPVRGAAPQGATDAESASRAVREMFTSIAPRYDFLNHLLSANVDKLWWRRTARTFGSILRRPTATALDLCCGTGDMALALRKQGSGARITGVDFSHPMLTRAYTKSRADAPITWIEADALQLPFRNNSFDLVTSAFGFRNLADYDAGLREIFRVLRPGGECGILDFSEPGGLVGKIYNVYFKAILPRVGRLVSGNEGAYAYLPASVKRFPSPPELLERMQKVGFHESSWTPYTFSIAGLFRGKKV
ncbi:MAG TPA: bifunctional demethylmenaquinone methyltransferase/2-methoxy-6-polyprenyl-1,4-benzoquinol methylase UbiE [Terriglobales bacterium]|nr:bifunctional demethylmenaquinone methyltransferase/2-methoxy-6-polyprenyl-1,4-benzoquinol methylase UbiE [Terriglobales bacterium]